MGWTVRRGHLVLIEPDRADADSCLTGLVEAIPDEKTVVVDLGSSPRLGGLPCPVQVSLYTPEAFYHAAAEASAKDQTGRVVCLHMTEIEAIPRRGGAARGDDPGRCRGLRPSRCVRRRVRRNDRPVGGRLPGQGRLAAAEQRAGHADGAGRRRRPDRGAGVDQGRGATAAIVGVPVVVPAHHRRRRRSPGRAGLSGPTRAPAGARRRNARWSRSRPTRRSAGRARARGGAPRATSARRPRLSRARRPHRARSPASVRS